jgi:hypothetical protein
MAVRLSALRARRALLHRNFFFSVSGTHFCKGLSQPQGLVLLEGLGKLKKSIHIIGTRTPDLPACSILPQPTTLPHAPNYIDNLSAVITEDISRLCKQTSV